MGSQPTQSHWLQRDTLIRLQISSDLTHTQSAHLLAKARPRSRKCAEMPHRLLILATLVNCPRFGRSFREVSCRPKGRFRVRRGEVSRKAEDGGLTLAKAKLSRQSAKRRLQIGASRFIARRFSWFKSPTPNSN